MAQPLQLTLAIIKPHITANPWALSSIRRRIVESGFFVVKSKMLFMDEQMAQKFYQEHEKRFFYDRLVTFMSSGFSNAIILAKNNAIQDWRGVLGPTKVFKSVISHPESVRGMFGLSDTRNVGHGSDSTESSKREIEFFFPDFNIEQWEKGEELDFRQGNVHLEIDQFEHRRNNINQTVK